MASAETIRRGRNKFIKAWLVTDDDDEDDDDNGDNDFHLWKLKVNSVS